MLFWDELPLNSFFSGWHQCHRYGSTWKQLVAVSLLMYLATSQGKPYLLSALSFFPFIAHPLLGHMNKSPHPGLHQAQLSWHFIIGKHCPCKLVPDPPPFPSFLFLSHYPWKSSSLSMEILVIITLTHYILRGLISASDCALVPKYLPH